MSSYLNKVIVKGLKGMILEYENTFKHIMNYKNEGLGGYLKILNFTEINSEYLTSEKFIGHIEKSENQELHVLYLNLIALLDSFQGQFPVNFLIKTCQLDQETLESKQKSFQLESFLYEITILVDNAKLSLDRAERIIIELKG
ncbi:MAG TPA: hypothetical protein VL125_02500 [Pelobium sp.]|nr:hypothetical protein [Pelobium sp.]